MISDPHSSRRLFQIAVAPRQGYFALHLPSVQDVGFIKENSQVFEDLRKHGPIHFEVYITAEEWTEKYKCWESTGITMNTTVDITIYGTRDTFKNVGRVLSDASLFLQHPQFQVGDDYENPHYLDLSDISDLDSETTLRAL